VIGSLSAATLGTKLIVLGVAAAFVLGGGIAIGLKWNAGQLADLKIEHAEQTARVAKLAKDAADKARKVEHAWGDAFIAVALKHEKERTDGAQAAYDRALADVRTGRVKLRPWWTCPVPRTAEAPGSPGKPDDAADLRAEAAARIVRIGAEADAYVRACQATLTAERDGNAVTR
jgi:hypothetical protein